MAPLGNSKAQLGTTSAPLARHWGTQPGTRENQRLRSSGCGPVAGKLRSTKDSGHHPRLARQVAGLKAGLYRRAGRRRLVSGRLGCVRARPACCRSSRHLTDHSSWSDTLSRNCEIMALCTAKNSARRALEAKMVPTGAGSTGESHVPIRQQIRAALPNLDAAHKPRPLAC